MDSLTWTQIQIVQPRPHGRYLCTLTAVTEDQLILHGGSTPSNYTWIMDLPSHSWRLYTSGKDHCRWLHTGSLGLNSGVIILGGSKDVCSSCDTSESNNIFHVMLEPKLLQQLAMQIIYKHLGEQPWELLPVKLISLLGVKRKV